MNPLNSVPDKRGWRAVIIFMAASLAAWPATAASIPVQSVQTNADRVTLTMSRGKMKLYETGLRATIPISRDDARRALEIGRRAGEFAGMAAEETDDEAVHYTGEAVTVSRTG